MKQFTAWRVRQLPGGVIAWTSPLGATDIDDPPPPVQVIESDDPGDDEADPPPFSRGTRRSSDPHEAGQLGDHELPRHPPGHCGVVAYALMSESTIQLASSERAALPWKPESGMRRKRLASGESFHVESTAIHAPSMFTLFQA